MTEFIICGAGCFVSCAVGYAMGHYIGWCSGVQYTTDLMKKYGLDPSFGRMTEGDKP